MNRTAIVVSGVMAIALSALLPARVIADSHPQEVLDLIAAHESLAMKIRPLQDRVVVRFKPEGVPVRAKAEAAADEGNGNAESRASERLRHKDRAVSSDDDYTRIKARLDALEKNAKTERERVNRPAFGTDLRRGKSEIAEARKRLAALQRELAALERKLDAPERAR
jgi:hypothetical protein